VAFLHPVIFKATPYVLRGMQPSEDRLSLDGRNRRFAGLDQLMNALGNLVAWGELRSSGRQGSATADELGGFWENRNRQKKLVNLAQGCADRTYAQWEEYCRAFDKGIAYHADSESPPAR
jgi:hypothetical protein